MAKGKLVVFEGIDGAGSTTQLKLFGKYLKKKKIKFIETCEPTGGPIGKLIRRALRHELKFSWDTLQLMYSADRADHLNKLINPNLVTGINVISDRYFLSTFAYGGINLEGKWLRQLNANFQEADMTFLIDTPVDVALGRIQRRSKNELFEKKKLLESVRRSYLAMTSEYSNVYILDGTKPIEEIAKKIASIFENNG